MILNKSCSVYGLNVISVGINTLSISLSNLYLNSLLVIIGYNPTLILYLSFALEKFLIISCPTGLAILVSFPNR